jgi:hypothetical protein
MIVSLNYESNNYYKLFAASFFLGCGFDGFVDFELHKITATIHQVLVWTFKEDWDLLGL